MKTNKLVKVVFIFIIFFTIICNISYGENKITVSTIPLKISPNNISEYFPIKKIDLYFFQNNFKKQKSRLVNINFKKNDIKLFRKFNIKTIQESTLNTKTNWLIWGEIIKIKNGFEINLWALNSFQNKRIIKISKNTNNTLEGIQETVNKCTNELISYLFKNKINIISKINIIGNKRVKEKSILNFISSKPKNFFQKEKIINDIKSIFNMGCFDSISVSNENYLSNSILTFKVKETPIINNILFVGNKKLTDKIIKENLDIHKGSFFKLANINETINKLKNIYRTENCYKINIKYSIHKIKNNKINLKFIFNENTQIFINKIFFYGNKTFGTKILKSLIKSSEKGSLSWLTNSGKLDQIILLQDNNQILNFYRNQGFLNVKIAKPFIRIIKNKCTIIFKIEEGKRFLLGKCFLEGDLLESKEKILQKLNSPKNKWININAIQKDILKISSMYSNMGFYNVEIFPNIITGSQNTKNLIFKIKKNKKIIIQNIEILGNTITNDRVIRRELKIKEYDIYNEDKIRMSLYNLKKLNYFSDITSQEIKYTNNNRIGIILKLKEKPTGQITFGAGYSTTDKFFINGSISQENFMGKGQSLRISGTLGSDIDRYNLIFNEPWLFNIPLSTTIRIYKEIEGNINSSNKPYKQIDTGLYLGCSYPLTNLTTLSLSYKYNMSKNKIKNIIINKPGEKYTSSSTTINIRYDSRYGIYYTKRGAKHYLTCTYGGLGGDLNFIKLESTLGYHIPLNKKMILSLRGKYGRIKDLYLPKNNQQYKPLRDRDLFHQGGMDSIRSYDYNTIGTKIIKDSNGNIISAKGGYQYLLFNAEIIYPLSEKLNLLGVIFYDLGQVFDENIDKFKDGVGCGLRWFSPIGPIRLEAAYKINNPDYKIKWNFAIGAPF